MAVLSKHTDKRTTIRMLLVEVYRVDMSPSFDTTSSPSLCAASFLSASPGALLNLTPMFMQTLVARAITLDVKDCGLQVLSLHQATSLSLSSRSNASTGSYTLSMPTGSRRAYS